MLGTVTVLRRYPVKSMLGEDLHVSDVTRRGLAHDRVLALVHRETGKVASAKNPRLWRGLLKLAASPSGPAVSGPEASGHAVKITLPDGTTVSSADPEVDAVLSRLLGQPVRLTGTPPPEATLDRADPEEVLRSGIEAQVPVEAGTLGAAATGSGHWMASARSRAPEPTPRSCARDRSASETSPDRHDLAAGGQIAGMEKYSLDAIAREQAKRAVTAPGGRSAQTVYGGHEHVLRQTVVALTAGSSLSEHENPGEATVQVLRGRVRLITAEATWEGRSGDLLVVPDARHALEAVEDSAVLLTVSKA